MLDIWAEPAGGAQLLTPAAVEIGYVTAAQRDHQGVPSLLAGPPPVGGQALAQRRRGGRRHDALGVRVGLGPLVGTPVAQRGERLAIPRRLLSAQLAQLKGALAL